MLDPVPYFIEEGAEHSAEVMRLMAYVMWGGQQGVLSRFDWRAAELPTPGTAVRVMPGAGAILNRAAGMDYQMYAGRSATETSVDISPTDSSGSRSDLIVIRVENPYPPGEGWPVPSDVSTGPYIHARVIENVPPDTQAVEDVFATVGVQSALTVARLDIPASTATITNDLITDLRVVSNPMTGLGPAPNGPGSEQLWTESTAGFADSYLRSTDLSYVDWPVDAAFPVNIPEWATGVDCFFFWTPYAYGNLWGSARVNIGGYPEVSNDFDVNYIGGGEAGGMRTILTLAGTAAIPADVRGTTATVKIQAKQNDSGPYLEVGDAHADARCRIYASLNFKQTPIYG